MIRVVKASISRHRRARFFVFRRKEARSNESPAPETSAATTNKEVPQRRRPHRRIFQRRPNTRPATFSAPPISEGHRRPPINKPRKKKKRERTPTSNDRTNSLRARSSNARKTPHPPRKKHDSRFADRERTSTTPPPNHNCGTPPAGEELNYAKGWDYLTRGTIWPRRRRSPFFPPPPPPRPPYAGATIPQRGERDEESYPARTQRAARSSARHNCDRRTNGLCAPHPPDRGSRAATPPKYPRASGPRQPAEISGQAGAAFAKLPKARHQRPQRGPGLLTPPPTNNDNLLNCREGHTKDSRTSNTKIEHATTNNERSTDSRIPRREMMNRASPHLFPTPHERHHPRAAGAPDDPGALIASVTSVTTPKPRTERFVSAGPIEKTKPPPRASRDSHQLPLVCPPAA